MNIHPFIRTSLYVSLALLIIAGLMACGKEEPYELPDNWVFESSTCENGVLDPGETDVDCGGDCPPCTQVEIPCTVNLGQLVYNNNTYNIIFVNVQSNAITIGVGGSISLTVSTGGNLAVNTTYSLTASTSPTGTNAYATLTDNGFVFKSQTGQGTFTIQGPASNPTYALCDAPLMLTSGNLVRTAKYKTTAD